MVRVGILYEPRLYADVIAQVFDGVRTVTRVDPSFSGVDVVVFPLTEVGKPDLDILPRPMPQGAKLVAVSPGLDRGLVRLPGESGWDEVRPFGLDQIFSEVLAGRERPEGVGHKTPPPVQPPRRVAKRPFRWPASLRLQWVPVPQWAAAFAALLVILSVSVSAMAFSTHSLPGEVLYSVKRLTESVQLALAPQASKPDLHFTRAQSRLEEITALALQGIVMQEIVEDLDSELQATLDTAQGLPDAEEKAVLDRLVAVTQDHEGRLRELVQKDVGVPLADDWENVFTILADRRQQALQAIAGLPTPVSTSTQTAPTPIPPGATSTAPPIQSQVPEPSESPQPTRTPEPTSTETPAPSETPSPAPTETAAPTETPEPTSAPTEPPAPSPTPEFTPVPPETPVPKETPLPEATSELTKMPEQTELWRMRQEWLSGSS